MVDPTKHLTLILFQAIYKNQNVTVNCTCAYILLQCTTNKVYTYIIALHCTATHNDSLGQQYNILTLEKKWTVSV